MNFLVMCSFLVPLVMAHFPGDGHNLDDELEQLKIILEKTDQIEIYNRKLDDFAGRLEYFHTHVKPLVEQVKTENKHPHDVVTGGGSIVDEEHVGMLEQLNGHLDYVIDTATMDSIK